MKIHSSSWQSAKKRLITLSCATALSLFAATTISTVSADEANGAVTSDTVSTVTQADAQVTESSQTNSASSNQEGLTDAQVINGQEYYYDDLGNQVRGAVAENTDGSYSYYNADTGAKSYTPGFVQVSAYAPNGNPINYAIYVQADGKLATGLQTIDGNQYYFDTYQLVVNQNFTLDGQKYLADRTGLVTAIPQNDYYTVNGNWYYADENGNNLTGAHTINGQEVYFNAQGVQAKGIFDGTGFNQYYYDQDTGAKWTNRFVQWEGSWYYLNDKGRRVTGLQTINGQTLYFGVTSAEGTGKQVKGKLTTIYDDTDNSHLYYFDQDTGDMWKNRYVQWEGNWYYLGDQGYALTNGQNTINGQTVYFFQDGKQAKGQIVTENGNRYYYDETTGQLLTNASMTIDGVTYQADAQGILNQ